MWHWFSHVYASYDVIGLQYLLFHLLKDYLVFIKICSRTIAKNLSHSLWLAIGPALLVCFHFVTWLILLIKNPVTCDWCLKLSAVVPWLYLVLHPNTSPTTYSIDIDELCVIVPNILLGKGSKYTRIILYSVVVITSGKCSSAGKRWSGNVYPFSSRLGAVSFIHHVGAGLSLRRCQSGSEPSVLAGVCSSQAAGLSAQVRLFCHWNCVLVVKSRVPGAGLKLPCRCYQIICVCLWCSEVFYKTSGAVQM